MNTKNQPALLPLRVDEQYGGTLVIEASPQGAGDPDKKPVAQVWFRGIWSVEQCRQYADYLTHSANTYQKSVEKMQHALRLGREGGDDATIRAAMVEIIEKHLRELGEAA